MDDQDKLLFAVNAVILCCSALSILRLLARRKVRRNRAHWVREILTKRNEEGAYALLIPKLMSDPCHFHNYFRMSQESFNLLLNLVEPQLDQIFTDTTMRKCISTRERLAVTLRYLATGKSKFVILS
jgi:hypothetical protein